MKLAVQIELLIDPAGAGVRDADVYAACLVEAGRIEGQYKAESRGVVNAVHRLSNHHGLGLSLQSP